MNSERKKQNKEKQTPLNQTQQYWGIPPKNTGSTISPFLIGTNKSDNVFNS